MKKHVSFRIIFVSIVLLCLVTLGMAFILARPTTTASAEITGDYSQYTDTKIHNGLNLMDYVSDYNTLRQTITAEKKPGQGTYFASTLQLRTPTMGLTTAVISGDDPIVNYIPRKLFTRGNETFVSGN